MSSKSASSIPHHHTDRSVYFAYAKGLAVVSYGVGAYVAGVTALLTLILMSLGVIELGPMSMPIGGTATAVLLNVAMLVAFAGQHSIMARKSFKDRWTRLIRPSTERATYLVATAVVLLPMLLLWQPIPTELWSVETPWLRGMARALSVFGWAYLFAASFALDHFALFGLRQVWNDFRGLPATPVQFHERWMYRFDRHPIMTGVLFGLWATPDMSVGRLVLVLGLSVYVLIGVHFEERALRREWGPVYDDYRRRVGTVVPLPFVRR